MNNTNIPDQYAPYQNNEFGFNELINNSSDNTTETIQPTAPLDVFTTPQPSITQLTVGQYLINMKNAIFGIGTDLASQGFHIDIFTKDNRLFYLGLFLIIIFIVYLFILNLATCY
ncbi:putative ORFan [Tupanvirus deep ocean]|uniref:ORFan n=2 Tax=Tupanvirus TaxID=2094720 RepID=A0AC62A8D6_9VIRU|nr:putative ORFan [Tupanvirus deep ocean]QKU33893.1 putative ORFan [Tupanvirus deep ocean]